MNPKRLIQYILAAGIILLLLVIIGAFVFPWKYINWGTFALKPAATVTVIGEAETQEELKKATFTAGFSAVSDKKDQAIDDVNKKISAITEAVKTFGIPAQDIKTQNLSIYQEDEAYTEGGRQKHRLGQWRVNNSIEIVLRDTAKTNALTEALTKAGANSVYGPNFALDENSHIGTTLLTASVEDARKKAELLAKGTQKNLGPIVTIIEGSNRSTQSTTFEGAGGGGGDLLPGSESVKKTVTVTFSLNDPTLWDMLQTQLKTKK